jgi:hypothetical protein
MMFLVLLIVFASVAAAIWFQGFWNAAVAFINILMAAMLATTLWEPVATMVEGFGATSYTYLLDFIVLWFLFGAIYGILRGITDLLSSTQVKFDLPVEMIGRSLLAVACGWLMTCFVAFSLHMAPLNSVNPLGAWATPASRSFLVAAPDRLWMRYMFDRSRGAFARGNFSGQQHPGDASLNVEAFDPKGEFALKYHQRRADYEKQSDLRVGGSAASTESANP